MKNEENKERLTLLLLELLCDKVQGVGRLVDDELFE
jgi:hypothetical protein